jgi:hypothetical protein
MSLKPPLEVTGERADHPEMVINRDECPLRTMEQIEPFFAANAEVALTAHGGGGVERYAHFRRVLRRFDYPRCSRHVHSPNIELLEMGKSPR